MRRLALATVTMMCILAGQAGATGADTRSGAQPSAAEREFLRMVDARIQARAKVKRYMVARSQGGSSELRKCTRLASDRVSCRYRYTYTANPRKSSALDSYCKGRVVVRQLGLDDYTLRKRGERCGKR